ncbi:hypothetical protein GJAV_G00149060 [Gymnothorax javanicus]|nr:hypothetical protein GJAV_G00149060 [Gymnothorax javanicus]
MAEGGEGEDEIQFLRTMMGTALAWFLGPYLHNPLHADELSGGLWDITPGNAGRRCAGALQGGKLQTPLGEPLRDIERAVETTWLVSAWRADCRAVEAEQLAVSSEANRSPSRSQCGVLGIQSCPLTASQQDYCTERAGSLKIPGRVWPERAC